MTAARVLFAVVVIATAGAAGAGRAGAASKSGCVGAAARDTKKPCVNPTRSITPSLAKRDNPAASRCKPVAGEPATCRFGVSAKKARATIALVGDSHALHWRSALEVVAKAKRWQGYSFTQPGCFFTNGKPDFPPEILKPCVDWNRALRRWLRAHPEVRTVFVSQAATTFVKRPAGKTQLQAKIAGFRGAWRALPKSVKRVIAIRDVPRTSASVFNCVRDVLAAGQLAPGPACPVDRSYAVTWDAAVATALRLKSRRYRYIDLTSFFCDPKQSCYPVIGGVLVYRDVDHMTVRYSETLGPYLLRKVRNILG